MSSLYGNNIKQVFRTVNLDENDDLFISDYIETNEKSAEVMWVMVTSADAKILDSGKIQLTEDGKTMLMSVDSPVNSELKIWDNKPVHYYDHDNPGTLRVGFIAKLPSNSKNKFIVSLKETNWIKYESIINNYFDFISFNIEGTRNKGNYKW